MDILLSKNDDDDNNNNNDGMIQTATQGACDVSVVLMSP